MRDVHRGLRLRCASAHRRCASVNMCLWRRSAGRVSGRSLPTPSRRDRRPRFRCWPARASIGTQNAVSKRAALADHQRMSSCRAAPASSTGRSALRRSGPAKLIASGVTFWPRSSDRLSPAIRVVDDDDHLAGAHRRRHSMRAKGEFFCAASASGLACSCCAGPAWPCGCVLLFNAPFRDERRASDSSFAARTIYLPTMSHLRLTRSRT